MFFTDPVALWFSAVRHRSFSDPNAGYNGQSQQGRRDGGLDAATITRSGGRGPVQDFFTNCAVMMMMMMMMMMMIMRIL